ncbi:MAG: HU family DNA-binding protein [Proteobacteria bacterium]|nr:HU family DNA-binding protein [Pseudomonadota bacterium]
MTKAELIAAIADKAGLKPDQAKTALDAFMSCVSEALGKGEDVRLVGFGTFTAVTKPARTGRNPRTGQSVLLPEQRAVKFRVGEGLKQAVA